MSSPARPRVGIDARKLTDFGIGSYVRNLLEAIARHPDSERYRFRVYVRTDDLEAVPALPERFEIVVEDSPGYSLSELTRFAWRLRRDRLDLFHATHYVVPPLARARAVVTIHDIIHVLYPQFLPNRAALLYARVMIRRALRRADRIITVSNNSKRDLVDYFGIAPSRIEVVYNGVAQRFRADVPAAERERVSAKYGLPHPYLLFLGGEKPHKNVRNVLRAFAEARRERALPHALVLAGPMPKNRSRVEALIAALDVAASVVRPGVVVEEDLPGLFAGADAFLYPTLYEGFGLPVAEAMACGVPVLTSSTSALQEIAGGYAYLVDPMDVDAIARGIVDLATDPTRRAEFAELGRRRAADFSWERAAGQTLRVYAEALSGKRPE
ncbi:MAG TPA: glycosyltransferase family 1 protein [Thermoanaerobaculia bacterium]|nr:glycosyltransferase family 1 protein [Thermoanaerobaculia bacterium]